MTIDQNAMNALFNDARTANGFIDKAVPAELLHKVYDLAKMGSTSMNCQPTRYIFLTTPAAKERVLGAMSPGNVAIAESGASAKSDMGKVMKIVMAKTAGKTDGKTVNQLLARFLK